MPPSLPLGHPQRSALGIDDVVDGEGEEARQTAEEHELSRLGQPIRRPGTDGSRGAPDDGEAGEPIRDPDHESHEGSADASEPQRRESQDVTPLAGVGMPGGGTHHQHPTRHERQPWSLEACACDHDRPGCQGASQRPSSGRLARLQQLCVDLGRRQRVYIQGLFHGSYDGDIPVERWKLHARLHASDQHEKQGGRHGHLLRKASGWHDGARPQFARTTSDRGPLVTSRSCRTFLPENRRCCPDHGARSPCQSSPAALDAHTPWPRPTRRPPTAPGR